MGMEDHVREGGQGTHVNGILGMETERNWPQQRSGTQRSMIPPNLNTAGGKRNCVTIEKEKQQVNGLDGVSSEWEE